MSYQHGSATSATDLLQQLVTWLTGIGWTSDRSAIEGSGWTATLHKSGNYVHLRAAMNETTIWHSNAGSAHYGLHMYLGTGFSSGQPFNNQTTGSNAIDSGFPVGVGMVLNAGPFSNYYFFSDSGGDNIVVVVEKTPGVFVHIEWGASINKAGSFTGGAYYGGSSAGYYTSFGSGGSNPGYGSSALCPFVNGDAIGGALAFVRADVDSYTGQWIGLAYTSFGAGQGGTSKIGDSAVRGSNAMRANFPVYAESSSANQFQLKQTSMADGRTNLLPISIYAQRDGTTTGFSMLGSIPNVFFTNGVGNGFSNADEYVIGSTTYKMFPNFAVVKQ